MRLNPAPIEDTLRSLGLTCQSLSVQQFIRAIEVSYFEPELLRYITKGLYPIVANSFKGSNGRAVERNLRSVRDRIWEQGNVELLCRMAGFKMTQRPTVGELLDIVLYHLKKYNLIQW